MSTRALLFIALVGALLVGFSGVVLAQQASPSLQGSARKHLASPGKAAEVCPGPVQKGKARCLSKVRTDVDPSLGSFGYQPADLQSAYNAPSSSAGSGITVGIVDAYDDPNAENDLHSYRSTFGLPECSSTNGCFSKVDQRGGTSYPSPDSNWAQEISLDLDMVSAICPNCHILLVETDDNGFNNLSAGVDEAASLGANAISNSYGGPEWSGETSYEGHYNHPGKAITVSSGDNGYGVEFPAASRYVTAIGGTSLTKDSASTRGWSETVWGSPSGGTGTGSGCSVYISKPTWQSDGGCDMRTVGDVAAVADPNTGVAVYDTYGASGWQQFGGTSIGSPIIAALYALAGNTSSVKDGSLSYSHSSSLNDVTSGSNGRCSASSSTASNTASANSEQQDDPDHDGRHPNHHPHHHRHHHHSPPPSPPPAPPSGAYLCNGEPGYDGPTGNGTPNGTGAF